MTRENWSIEDYEQALDAAERERDIARQSLIDLGRSHPFARAKAAEQRLDAVRALADEWAEDYPSDLAACDYAPDKWWRDLRAALGDADGGEGRG